MTKTTGASHVAEIKPGVRIIGAHTPGMDNNAYLEAYAQHLREQGYKVERVEMPMTSEASKWFYNFGLRVEQE